MKEWYKLSDVKVIKELNSSIDGLKNEKAARLLKKYGSNELPKKKKDSIIKLFLSEFKDPIILLLIVAIILSFVAHEPLDACAIIFIIMLDAVVGTIQEWNAEKSAEALENLIKVKVKIRRDGKEVEVDSSELVVGDIVLLESGNKISADLRIIEARNLTVDESILTGESINSVKFNDFIKDDVSLADRKNMLFAGTSVITGRSTAIVVETGTNTEIGKIAKEVSSTVETPSPLTIRMSKFSKQISFLIIVIAFIVTALLVSKGNDMTTIFLAVIALSVSAMPEGLPLALTMALTIGSTRMAKKNVIVKKLNAVESLGSCTVIASDKTGTLTVNEQTAKKIVLPDDMAYDILGTGYNIKGKIVPIDKAKIEKAIYLSELGVINNESSFTFENKVWKSMGDSIDIAFLALGNKAGIINKRFNKLGTIPYESENKYSAVFYERDNESYCTVKGSLEKIFEFCTHMEIDGKLVKLD